MTQQIAQQWLNEVADTANQKNLQSHMDLISRRIRLYGVPGFEAIGYDDWYRQCEHEFEDNILKGVQYEGLKMIADTDSTIKFMTFETVEGNDGMVNAHGVEILLEQEPDGKWRMIMQRIMSDEETINTGLLPKSLSD